MSAPPPPRSHALRTGRHSQPGQVYLVTTVTLGRAPFFTDFHIARRVVQTLRHANESAEVQIWAYVLMPDHLHWMFTLGESAPLSRVVRDVKAVSSHRAGRALWQKGFHDHALRSEESLREAARYIILNPVRAGLVQKAGDYPHWDAVWVP